MLCQRRVPSGVCGKLVGFVEICLPTKLAGFGRSWQIFARFYGQLFSGRECPKMSCFGRFLPDSGPEIKLAPGNATTNWSNPMAQFK